MCVLKYIEFLSKVIQQYLSTYSLFYVNILKTATRIVSAVTIDI